MPTRARQVEEPIGRKPRFFRRRPGPRRTFASVAKIWDSYGRNREVGQYNRHTTKCLNLCPPSAVRSYRSAVPLRKARLGFLLAGQHGPFRRDSTDEIKSRGATIECVTSSKAMLADSSTKLKLAFPLRRRRSWSSNIGCRPANLPCLDRERSPAFPKRSCQCAPAPSPPSPCRSQAVAKRHMMLGKGVAE